MLRSLRTGWRQLYVVGALLLVGGVTVFCPALARGQTPEELARARQVFNDGKLLEDKQAWDLALERFRAVARVKMTPQVRFHIALCEENLGRLVQAIKGFELAAEEARAAGIVCGGGSAQCAAPCRRFAGSCRGASRRSAQSARRRDAHLGRGSASRDFGRPTYPR